MGVDCLLFLPMGAVTAIGVSPSMSMIIITNSCIKVWSCALPVLLCECKVFGVDLVGGIAVSFPSSNRVFWGEIVSKARSSGVRVCGE